MMKREILLSLFVLAAAGTTNAIAAAGDAAGNATEDVIARGRYLVAIGGCNDCHTAGFLEKEWDVPEAQRLTGLPVGFSGPWGVSYPSNLRLVAAKLDEAGWKKRIQSGGRPPMPWPSVRAMSEADQIAVYQYLRHLGPAGEPAPQAIAPGQPITTPHFVFVPQAPDIQTTSALAR
jgi:hypothetical protein